MKICLDFPVEFNRKKILNIKLGIMYESQSMKIYYKPKRL